LKTHARCDQHTIAAGVGLFASGRHRQPKNQSRGEQKEELRAAENHARSLCGFLFLCGSA
jgi:hypothetical protein